MTDLVLHAKKDAFEVDRDDTVPRLLISLNEVFGHRVVNAGDIAREVEPPNLCTVPSTVAWTSLFPETSHNWKTALPPACSTRRTVSDPSVGDMSATTTIVPARPNATATARPIPDPAPVTRATLSIMSPTASPDRLLVDQCNHVEHLIAILIVVGRSGGLCGRGLRRLTARRSFFPRVLAAAEAHVYL